MELFCFTPKNEKTRKALFCKALRVFVKKHWSERHDLNVRPLPPQGSALAKLSYAPTLH